MTSSGFLSLFLVNTQKLEQEFLFDSYLISNIHNHNNDNHLLQAAYFEYRLFPVKLKQAWSEFPR